METNKPIYWHQGMFLEPQHFQFADLYTDFRLKPFWTVGLPYFWGIGELKISNTSLANRLFEIESLNAILRDYTYIEFPGNAVLKPRSFENAWEDPNKPFRVYLGIKKLNLAETNVVTVRHLAEGVTLNTRYVTTHEANEYNDIYSGGPVTSVQNLNLVIHLVWENEIEQLTDYEIIPIALLERNGDTVRLSPYFIPPCYELSGSGTLLGLVKEIRDDLSGRAHQLEQYKSPRELQKAEFDASYMVFLLALRTLNRYIPLLCHYMESPTSHPWHLYGILRQLISELSTFSERYNMLGEQKDGSQALPLYEHTDLGHCLFAAQSLIAQLLNEITVGPELLVFLEPHDNYLAAELPRHFFNNRNRFYLILRSETDANTLIHSFQTESKLSTLNELPNRVRRALPGVELIHLPVAPQGLPRRSYSYYFRVDTASEAWEQVEKEGSIALDWPEAPEDLKAELVVIRR